MTEHVVLSVLGTQLLVRSDDAALLKSVAKLWAPFARAHVPAGPSHATYDVVGGRLFRDGEAIDADLGETWLLASLCADINRTAIDQYAGFAAHAAVVAHGNTVVAAPAESGTGKTTFAAACVGSGWAYVSDESLCLRYHDANVEPYPKPLALSPWSAHAVGLAGGIESGGEQLATANDLGGTAVTTPLRLTDVVLLRRSPELPARLEERHPAETLPLLLRMSFNHFRRPEDAFRLAGVISAGCRLWELSYSDPVAAAAEVTATLL